MLRVKKQIDALARYLPGEYRLATAWLVCSADGGRYRHQCDALSLPSVLLLLAWSLTAVAHPETAPGSCHFHTDSVEQHCAPDKQRSLDNSEPAVVQPLLEDTSPDGAANDESEAGRVVQHFRQLEEQSDLIAGIQGGLARLGYDPGMVSGSMNPATEAAIIEFQNDNLLPPSGQPSLSLLAIIEDELKARQERRGH